MGLIDQMKYRTKLYIALVAIAFIASFLGLAITYFQAKNRLTLSLRERVIAVSSTTGSLLSPEFIQQVIAGGGKTPEYQDLVLKLRSARDANRTASFYVKFLYVMTISPQNPNQMIFVADAEENPTEMIQFGEVDQQEKYSHIREHLNEKYSPPRFITDQWGTWMSGFAPIYTADGHYLATVGADVSINIIQEHLNEVFAYGLWGLFGSITIAFIGAYFLSKQVTKSLSFICESVKEIGAGNLQQETHLDTHDEFNDLAEAINDMTKGLRERERLKMNFTRYVSQHVLEKIMKSDSFMKLEGERRKITVLFSDIRQFTALAERLPPEQVVQLLNEYFEAMIDIIFANQGTLDKFLGDGLMVEFGAPLEDNMQELHAMQTAIEMQKKLTALCEKWVKEGKPEIKMGIGLHTGYAIVGNIGSEKRMEYTAIGDTVNVAARLEQATKILNMPILISEETFKAVKHIFDCKNLGSMSLPGRTEEITVYTIQSHKHFE
jgi:adenylate cyclase